jgi:hypothetical protein
MNEMKGKLAQNDEQLRVSKLEMMELEETVTTLKKGCSEASHALQVALTEKCSLENQAQARSDQVGCKI